MYRFDEVVFELPADSTITTKQIENDFEKYWEYGKTDQAGKDEDMKDDEPDPESGGNDDGYVMGAEDHVCGNKRRSDCTVQKSAAPSER